MKSEKRQINVKRGGKGRLRQEDNPKPFTKDAQPTPAQKKAGWAKKRRGAELVKYILEQKFNGAKDGVLKKTMAEYFGCPESEITNEMVMIFRQAEKSISKSDTPAFNAVYDRAYGKASQQMDITSDGKPLNPPTIIVHDDATKKALANLKKK